MKRFLLPWLWSAVMAALLSLAAKGAMADAAGEGQVKAAFVFNVMRYVDWPEASLAADHFLVCRAGPETVFASALQVLDGRSMRGRSIKLRTLAEGDSVAACQVLILVGTADGRLIREASGRPILTVGEGWGFLDEGGMVALAVVDGRLAFGANMNATRAGGLRLSAQLLKLANRVVDTGR